MLDDINVNIGEELDTSITREYGKIRAVVRKLVKHFSSNVGHKVYYSLLNLFNILKQQEIQAVGRVLNTCFYSADKLINSQKELLKEGRGWFDNRVDTYINVTVKRQMDGGVH